MTGFDQLERQLLERIAERGRSRRASRLRRALRARTLQRSPLRSALAACALAGAAILATLLIGSAGQLSTAARAYAATDTAGKVVNYVELASYAPPPGLGLRQVKRRAVVWASGGRSRVVEAVTLISLSGKHTVVHNVSTSGAPGAESEAPQTNGGSAAQATLAHVIPKAACAASPGCAPAAATPISALRRLYRQGKLRDAGHTERNGRRLDVIVSGEAPSMRILVDPHSFLPVEIVTSYRSPGSGALVARTTITDYHRLPLTSRATGMLAPRCHSQRLSARLGPTIGSTGSLRRIVTFTNDSRFTCTLYGYPGMLMLGAHGGPLPTYVRRGSYAIVPPVSEATVALRPGGHASFAAGYASFGQRSRSECPQSAQVEITPPNAYQPVTVRWALRLFGRPASLGHRCGVVTVSPVYQGTGAPPYRAPQSATQASVRCHSSQLTVNLGRSGLAAGHESQVVTFTNVSGTPCHLYGYPGMQMLGADRRRMPSHVRWGASYIVPALSPRRVLIRPGAHASFEAGYEDGTGFGITCPAAMKVLITPPNAYRPLAIRWPLRPYGGPSHSVHACGEVTVSPVYPGSGQPR